MGPSSNNHSLLLSSVTGVVAVLIIFLLLLLAVAIPCYCHRRRKQSNPVQREMATYINNDYEVMDPQATEKTNDMSQSSSENHQVPLTGDSTIPLYEVIPGGASKTPYTNNDSYRNTNSTKHGTTKESLHDLDQQTLDNQGGDRPAGSRKPALRMYDTVTREHTATSSSDEPNEATYSSLKYNFKICSSQCNESTHVGTQGKHNATTNGDTATKLPAEAQYSSLKHNIKVSCLQRDTGDQYDIIACKNAEGTRKNAPEPTYSTLDSAQTPPQLQPQGSSNEPQQGDTVYEVIKSENIQETDGMKPNNVVKKTKESFNCSVITPEVLTATMSSDIELAATECINNEMSESPMKHVTAKNSIRQH